MGANADTLEINKRGRTLQTEPVAEPASAERQPAPRTARKRKSEIGA